VGRWRGLRDRISEGARTRHWALGKSAQGQVTHLQHGDAFLSQYLNCKQTAGKQQLLPLCQPCFQADDPLGKKMVLLKVKNYFFVVFV